MGAVTTEQGEVSPEESPQKKPYPFCPLSSLCLIDHTVGLVHYHWFLGRNFTHPSHSLFFLYIHLSVEWLYWWVVFGVTRQSSVPSSPQPWSMHGSSWASTSSLFFLVYTLEYADSLPCLSLVVGVVPSPFSSVSYPLLHGLCMGGVLCTNIHLTSPQFMRLVAFVVFMIASPQD